MCMCKIDPNLIDKIKKNNQELKLNFINKVKFFAYICFIIIFGLFTPIIIEYLNRQRKSKYLRHMEN